MPELVGGTSTATPTASRDPVSRASALPPPFHVADVGGTVIGFLPVKDRLKLRLLSRGTKPKMEELLLDRVLDRLLEVLGAGLPSCGIVELDVEGALRKAGDVWLKSSTTVQRLLATLFGEGMKGEWEQQGTESAVEARRLVLDALSGFNRYNCPPRVLLWPRVCKVFRQLFPRRAESGLDDTSPLGKLLSPRYGVLSPRLNDGACSDETEDEVADGDSTTLPVVRMSPKGRYDRCIIVNKATLSDADWAFACLSTPVNPYGFLMCSAGAGLQLIQDDSGGRRRWKLAPRADYQLHCTVSTACIFASNLDPNEVDLCPSMPVESVSMFWDGDVPPDVVAADYHLSQPHHWGKLGKELMFPPSVKTIGCDTFSWWSTMRVVDLRLTRVTTIEDRFFFHSSLEIAHFPGTLTKIGSGFLTGCAHIQRISLRHAALTQVGSDFCRNCRKLEQLSLPSSLKAIWCGFCFDTPRLNRLEIARETIATKKAFLSWAGSGFMAASASARLPVQCQCEGCQLKLDWRDLPVSSLSGDFFRANVLLGEIRLPQVLRCMGSDSLGYCASLRVVDLSACSELKQLPAGFCRNCPALSTVRFPTVLEYIGANSFVSCRVLAEVELPSSLTGIGERCFAECNALRTISCTPGVPTPAYQVERGRGQGIGKDFARQCPSLQKVDLRHCPFEEIGDSFCRGCKSLLSVTCPDSVRAVGEWFLAGCESLPMLDLRNTKIRDVGKHFCRWNHLLDALNVRFPLTRAVCSN